MAAVTTAVVATSPAVALAPLSGTAGNRRPRNVKVFNNGPQTEFVGPSGVTVANGFPIPAGGSHTFEKCSDALFVVCGTLQVSPADTRVLTYK